MYCQKSKKHLQLCYFYQHFSNICSNLDSLSENILIKFADRTQKKFECARLKCMKFAQFLYSFHSKEHSKVFAKILSELICKYFVIFLQQCNIFNLSENIQPRYRRKESASSVAFDTKKHVVVYIGEILQILEAKYFLVFNSVTFS